MVPLVAHDVAPDQQHQHFLRFCWKCRISGPTSDLLNLNLNFNKIPRRFICTFKLEMFSWYLHGKIVVRIKRGDRCKPVITRNKSKCWIILGIIYFTLRQDRPQWQLSYETSCDFAIIFFSFNYSIFCLCFTKISVGTYDNLRDLWGHIYLFYLLAPWAQNNARRDLQ